MDWYNGFVGRDTDSPLSDGRPDPDALLKEVQRAVVKRGRLKIFLGYAPGVGKTYAMLQEGHARKARGEDIVVGIVETHGRSETDALLAGLEVMVRRQVDYGAMTLSEFDIDAALARRPSILLVDELAHTNAPGSRHPKRYQDVEELLAAGIDVYTTVNVQHFESHVDTVAQITGIRVQETIPDTLLEGADEVQVVDIPLEELAERLKEGKVYIPEQAARAMENFFQRGNLVALRELTLTAAARKMGSELANYMRARAISGPWAAGERVMACVGPGPYANQLLRKAYTIAKDANAEWYAVYVSSSSSKELSAKERLQLSDALNLAEELGAKIATLTGADIAEEIIRFAGENNITRVVIGKPLHSALAGLFRRSPVYKLLQARAQFELHLVTPSGQGERERAETESEKKVHFDVRSYGITACMVAVVTIADFVLERLVAPASLVFIYLVVTIAAALRFGTGPSFFASLLSLLAFDYFFTEPRYSFSMYHPSDIVNVAIFLFTSLIVGQLAKRTRQQNVALHLRLRRVTLIEEMSKEFLSLPPVEQLIGGFSRDVSEWKSILPVLRTTVLDEVSHVITKYVGRVVDAGVFVLFAGADGKLRVWARSSQESDLDLHDLAVADWVFMHGEMAGAGTQTLANAKALFMPMKSGDDVIGVIGIEYPYKNLLVDQRRLLGAIANLSALGAVRWVKV